MMCAPTPPGPAPGPAPAPGTSTGGLAATPMPTADTAWSSAAARKARAPDEAGRNCTAARNWPPRVSTGANVKCCMRGWGAVGPEQWAEDEAKEGMLLPTW